MYTYFDIVYNYITYISYGSYVRCIMCIKLFKILIYTSQIIVDQMIYDLGMIFQFYLLKYDIYHYIFKPGFLEFTTMN